MSDSQPQNTTINMQIYITAHYGEYQQKFTFQGSTYNPALYDKTAILIGTKDIKVVIPANEAMIPQYIAGLKESQTEVRIEMMQKIEAIQERINKVSSIEHKPDTVE